MQIVESKAIPVYEVTCFECRSVIRYKACEVSMLHIGCPVCGVSIMASVCNPVCYELPKANQNEMPEPRQLPEDKLKAARLYKRLIDAEASSLRAFIDQVYYKEGEAE